MKKRNRILRRCLTLTLTLLLALGCLWPSLVTDAAEFSIDESGFSTPKIDHCTLYIWRRGFPTADSNDDVGVKRDMLIVWDGKYFLKWDPNFSSTMVRLFPMYHGSDKEDLNTDHLGWADAYEPWLAGVKKGKEGEITWKNGRYPYDGTNSWDKAGKYPNGYPHGWYMYTVDYPSNAGLVSSLPFNYSALEKADIAGSLKPVNATLPFACYAGKSQNASAYGLGIHHAYFTSNYDVWLASDHRLHTSNENHTWSADVQLTYIRATLDYWKAGDKFANNGKHSFADSTWRVLNSNNKKVTIESNGKGYVEITTDGFADNQDKNDLYYISGSTSRMFGYMALAHQGSVFRTVGNAKQKKYNSKTADTENGRSPHLADGKDEFDVYWCESIIMDFLQTNFPIEDGQVSNLDGPIAIANGTVITVKDGGTLTIDDWVANNGTIKIEKGGTLYIQDNACLNRLNDGAHDGGGIICEGLILVGPNGKLVGGGVDGIQLKGSGHIVNYGLVASENFKVENPYSIENRDGGVVFTGEGSGVTGSGMGTWGNPVSAAGYMEKGKIEPTCVVSLAPNAIYNN